MKNKKEFLKNLLIMLLGFICGLIVFSYLNKINKNKRVIKIKKNVIVKKVNFEIKDTPEEAIRIVFNNDRLARAIAMAESNFNCKAISKTNDYGLFQINQIHLSRMKKLGLRWDSCIDNAKFAKLLVEERERKVKGAGWLIWSVYVNKSYYKFY